MPTNTFSASPIELAGKTVIDSILVSKFFARALISRSRGVDWHKKICYSFLNG